MPNPVLPPLQSTLPRQTNVGIPLHSEYHGGESDTIREIPPEWRAALDLQVTEQPVPLDYPLFELDDEILASKLEQKQTSEKTIRTTRKPPGTFTLFERYTDRNKEFGVRQRNFKFINLISGIATPSALQTVHTRNFGNKHFEEIIETIPSLFVADEYLRERPVVTPSDFRAKLEEDEHGFTEVGIASDPSTPLPIGVISHKDTQEDVYTHRELIRSIDLLSLPVEIDNEETNRFKQVVTVKRILELDTTTPSVPTALRDVEFTKLGDGTALEVRKEIPSVFDNIRYDRSRPIVTPEDFRAELQEDEVSQTSAGTAADPTLSGGEFHKTDEQLDEFIHRTSTHSIDLLSLPVSIVNKRTNRFKQVETVTRTLEDDSTTPASPTALTDVEFTKLGDGTALEISTSVDSVFPGPLYRKSIQNLIPAEFRAFIPTFESEITSTGIANPSPTLGIGELSHEEQQIDEFNIRTKSTNLGSISTPVTLTNEETTEEFGGGVLDVVMTLDTSGSLTIDTGPFVVSSRLVQLGNGYDIKTTKLLHGMSPSWPTLTEYDQDPETQSLITTTYQVVDASSVSAPSIVNGQITRYKKIDVWRSLKIVEVYSLPAAYDEQRFMAHQFPSLWDASTYNYSTACGPTGPIRQGFSTMVQARLHISYTTSKITITGLTLIPNTIRLVHDVINAVLNDAGTIVYSGTCSGPISFPDSSPNFTTYTTTIQGTEQLISGESVLWRAGLYKNSELYITML